MDNLLKNNEASENNNQLSKDDITKFLDDYATKEDLKVKIEEKEAELLEKVKSIY